MQDKIDDKAGYTGKKDKGHTMIFSNINNLIINSNSLSLLIPVVAFHIHRPEVLQLAIKSIFGVRRGN